MKTAEQTAQRCFVWHFKSFDFYQPQCQLETYYGRKVKIHGLLTGDSSGSPAEQQYSFLGIPRISALRLQFYRDCCQALKQQYLAEGCTLQTFSQSTAQVFQTLAREHQAPQIWLPSCQASEESRFIDELISGAPEQISFHFLRPNTLLDQDELPFAVQDTPETFSAFRRRIEKSSYELYRFSKTSRIREFTDSPGRTRIDKWIFQDKSILCYKETRNGLGPGDYSSRLSKWLAAGTLSSKEVGAAVRHFEAREISNQSTYWLLFELLWRDFFYYLHGKIGDLIFQPKGMKRRQSPGLNDALPWSFKGSNRAIRYRPQDREYLFRLWHGFRRWALASTGQRFIDAIMKELFHTGEISNRARQCAASYLIHDLHVPWWWGAQWFEHLLLDYDVSSNWGNWAYIAGVGADSRPVRHFNIARQSKTHDPEGAYQNWVEQQRWCIPDDYLAKIPPA